MKNLANPSEQFAANFSARCPGFALRAERESDKPFLVALFSACSPLATSLPQAMIEQQAWIQHQGYREEFSSASRWIVLRGEEPIGRIIIDWDIDGLSQCIDVAIIPSEQNVGIGAVLLSAWIAISNRLGRDSCLQVLADSRAKNLYVRLGFIPVGDPYQPSITMRRPSAS